MPNISHVHYVIQILASHSSWHPTLLFIPIKKDNILILNMIRKMCWETYSNMERSWAKSVVRINVPDK